MELITEMAHIFKLLKTTLCEKDRKIHRKRFDELFNQLRHHEVYSNMPVGELFGLISGKSEV